MLIMIQNAWLAWADLFKGLPYGDPYIAMAVLFVITVILVRYAAGDGTS